MSRNRVPVRGELVYSFLKENLNTPFRFQDLSAALNIRDSNTTRSAIRYARELAEADGLHFPIACPANGFVYEVTDDGAKAIDPSLHLGRLAQGVENTKEVADDFMRKTLRHMDPASKPLAKAAIGIADKKREALGQISQAFDEMSKALIEARKAIRQTEGSDKSP